MKKEPAIKKASAKKLKEQEPTPAQPPQPVQEETPNLHTSTDDKTKRAFKRKLKKAGIELGFINDSYFGLMNHTRDGRQYRLAGDGIEQFDRDAYTWRPYGN